MPDDQGSVPLAKDFFISYNRADRQWAEWLAWTLEEAGYSVVIEAWDFRPGGNLVVEMHRAASDTRSTAVVLSPEYLAAEYTHPEWAAAFSCDPQGRKRKLIPFRVAECDPDGLLRSVIYVDLVGLGKEEAKLAVLDALKDRLKPDHEPDFPRPSDRGEEPAPFPPTAAKVENAQPTGPALGPRHSSEDLPGKGELPESARNRPDSRRPRAFSDLWRLFRSQEPRKSSEPEECRGALSRWSIMLALLGVALAALILQRHFYASLVGLGVPRAILGAPEAVSGSIALALFLLGLAASRLGGLLSSATAEQVAAALLSRRALPGLAIIDLGLIGLLAVLSSLHLIWIKPEPSGPTRSRIEVRAEGRQPKAVELSELRPTYRFLWFGKPAHLAVTVVEPVGEYQEETITLRRRTARVFVPADFDPKHHHVLRILPGTSLLPLLPSPRSPDEPQYDLLITVAGESFNVGKFDQRLLCIGIGEKEVERLKSYCGNEMARRLVERYLRSATGPPGDGDEQLSYWQAHPRNEGICVLKGGDSVSFRLRSWDGAHTVYLTPRSYTVSSRPGAEELYLEFESDTWSVDS